MTFLANIAAKAAHTTSLYSSTVIKKSSTFFGKRFSTQSIESSSHVFNKPNYGIRLAFSTLLLGGSYLGYSHYKKREIEQELRTNISNIKNELVIRTSDIKNRNKSCPSIYVRIENLSPENKKLLEIYDEVMNKSEIAWLEMKDSNISSTYQELQKQKSKIQEDYENRAIAARSKAETAKEQGLVNYSELYDEAQQLSFIAELSDPHSWNSIRRREENVWLKAEKATNKSDLLCLELYKEALKECEYSGYDD